MDGFGQVVQHATCNMHATCMQEKPHMLTLRTHTLSNSCIGVLCRQLAGSHQPLAAPQPHAQACGDHRGQGVTYYVSVCAHVMHVGRRGSQPGPKKKRKRNTWSQSRKGASSDPPHPSVASLKPHRRALCQQQAPTPTPSWETTGWRCARPASQRTGSQPRASQLG